MNFRANFSKNKVGMEYEELTAAAAAAARYVDSKSMHSVLILCTSHTCKYQSSHPFCVVCQLQG
jgi:hypothetical protein